MEHRLFDAAFTRDLQVHLVLGPGRKAVIGWPAFDTLLGPEGSSACSFLKAGIRSGPPPWCTAWSSRKGGAGRRQERCGGRPYVENYTVDASIFVAQVFKGARWMPWHQEPKKDVGICDKPRGVDNQTVIRGFPNGETRLEASPVTPA